MTTIEEIRLALLNPNQRWDRLDLIEALPFDDKVSLFPDLLELCSVAHSDLDKCQVVLLSSYPNDWLVSHIEEYAEPTLAKATYEEYRCLLHLYILVDVDLLNRLVERAINHEDPDIQEAGQDFLY